MEATMSSVDQLASRAMQHWAEFLPEKTADLKEAGTFEMRAAGRGAGDGGNQALMRSGVPEDEAEGDGAAGVHPAEARAEAGVSPAEARPQSLAANFRITEDVRLGKGGEIEKYNDNLRAIQIVKTLRPSAAVPRLKSRLRWPAMWAGGGLPSAFRNPRPAKSRRAGSPA